MTALFSMVDVAILRPLPYPHPQQLVRGMVAGSTAGQAYRMPIRLSTAEIQGWTDVRRIFSHVAAAGACGSGFVIDDGPEPEQLGRFECQSVTPEYFEMLGVAPMRGRTFQNTDTADGAPKVVIIGDRYWLRHYGRDPNVVGRMIRLVSRLD